MQNVSNNGILGYSLDFNNFGNNQHKAFKQKIIPEKDKLPEIKTNIQKWKFFEIINYLFIFLYVLRLLDL